MQKPAVLIFSLCFLIGCATSPLNRRQVVIFSEADMVERGERQYEEMRREVPLSSNMRDNRYVECVASSVINALDESQRRDYVWEVTVFDNEQANAFALPGGKIGVYSGMLGVAVNQHQLAAVIAHEVGHVLADHSNERTSQATLRNIGVAVAQIAGVPGSTLEVLDYGTQIGLFLPFNRTQESEADRIGVILMAEAGFDPRQAVFLWQNMRDTQGPRPPEFLSTHPSPDSRIDQLLSLMGSAVALREAANRRGINPDCLP